MTAIRLIVAVALLAGIMGQGCPAPTPQGSTPPPICDRDYHHDLGFGVNPVPNSVGSLQPPATANMALLVHWDSPIALASMSVSVPLVGVTLEAYRQYRLEAHWSAGEIVTEETFFDMPSGVRAWYHEIYTPELDTYTASVDAVARNRVFGMSWFYSPRTSPGDAALIGQSVQSFCVEP